MGWVTVSHTLSRLEFLIHPHTTWRRVSLTLLRQKDESSGVGDPGIARIWGDTAKSSPLTLALLSSESRHVQRSRRTDGREGGRTGTRDKTSNSEAEKKGVGVAEVG